MNCLYTIVQYIRICIHTLDEVYCIRISITHIVTWMAIQALVHLSRSRSPCALVSFNGGCDDDILQSVFLLHISLKAAVVGIDIYDGGLTK